MSRAEITEAAENTDGIWREARGIQIEESAERENRDIHFSARDR